VMMEESGCRITIFNMFGKVLVDERISDSRYQVQTSRWPAGIYLLRIDKDESVTSYKLMIKE
jgi:hypothetical protein